MRLRDFRHDGEIRVDDVGDFVLEHLPQNVTLPLRDILEQAPSSFLLIHRSYAVNPAHLERIERDGRSYRLILTNNVILPISKHRLREVLPRVKKSLRPPQ